MSLVNNVELNPVIEQFVTTQSWEQSTNGITEADGAFFDVSVKSAVKLLHPLLYAEFENRGYSDTHIRYRLWRAQDTDIELVDTIDTILAELNEDYNN